jgi:hypothetical protein
LSRRSPPSIGHISERQASPRNVPASNRRSATSIFAASPQSDLTGSRPDDDAPADHPQPAPEPRLEPPYPPGAGMRLRPISLCTFAAPAHARGGFSLGYGTLNQRYKMSLFFICQNPSDAALLGNCYRPYWRTLARPPQPLGVREPHAHVPLRYVPRAHAELRFGSSTMGA